VGEDWDDDAVCRRRDVRRVILGLWAMFKARRAQGGTRSGRSWRWRHPPMWSAHWGASQLSCDVHRMGGAAKPDTTRGLCLGCPQSSHACYPLYL